MRDAVNSVNSSLYFSATSNAVSEVAKETNKKKRLEQNHRKFSFADALRKNLTEEEYLAAGFPPEIIGMEIEEAAIFLKDRMDEAADRLANDFTREGFTNYRLAVNQFVKYIVKNNFTVEKQNRFGVNKRTGKKRDPLLQIQIINQKLDMLAMDMRSIHLDKLKLLARVNEIQGMIIDLLG